MSDKPLIRFTLRWSDVARPDGLHVSPDRALLAWRWLSRTARKHWTQVRWGSNNPNGILSCNPGILSKSEPDPICSVRDLHERLQYAVLALDDGPATRAWREEIDLRFDSKRVIFGVHRAGTGYLLDSLLSEISNREQALERHGKGRCKLAVALNYVHRDAREAIRVEIALGTAHDTFGLRADLVFGSGGSEWRHTLAVEKTGEPISDMLRRAHVILVALLDRTDAPIVEPIYDNEHPYGVFRDRGDEGRTCKHVERHLCSPACSWERLSTHADIASAVDEAVALISQETP